jgi:hypothetical protein
MFKTIVTEVGKVALPAALVVIASAVPAHAESILSPEDPSLVLALVGGGAAAAPFVVAGVRALLKAKKKQLPTSSRQ